MNSLQHGRPLNVDTMGYIGGNMSEETGWEPAQHLVNVSEVESKVATIIEEDSLDVINSMSSTDGLTTRQAKMARNLRGELRVDTTSEEQKKIIATYDYAIWAVVGTLTILTFVGLWNFLGIFQ